MCIQKRPQILGDKNMIERNEKENICLNALLNFPGLKKLSIIIIRTLKEKRYNLFRPQKNGVKRMNEKCVKWKFLFEVTINPICLSTIVTSLISIAFRVKFLAIFLQS